MDELGVEFSRAQNGRDHADMYGLYARMREAPFLELDHGGYGEYVVVSRYDTVRQLYLDEEHFLSHPHWSETPAVKAQVARNGQLSEEDDRKESEPAAFTKRVMVLSVAPVHDRLRKVFGRAFNARSVRELEPGVQKMVDRTLRRLAGSDEIDFAAEIGHRVPHLTHMGRSGCRRAMLSSSTACSRISKPTRGLGRWRKCVLPTRSSRHSLNTLPSWLRRAAGCGDGCQWSRASVTRSTPGRSRTTSSWRTTYPCSTQGPIRRWR